MPALAAAGHTAGGPGQAAAAAGERGEPVARAAAPARLAPARAVRRALGEPAVLAPRVRPAPGAG